MIEIVLIAAMVVSFCVLFSLIGYYAMLLLPSKDAQMACEHLRRKEFSEYEIANAVESLGYEYYPPR